MSATNRVFVDYSPTDKAVVDPIVNLLRIVEPLLSDSLNAFELTPRLDDANTVLLFWSRQAEPLFPLETLRKGVLDAGHRVVLIRLDATDLPAALANVPVVDGADLLGRVQVVDTMITMIANEPERSVRLLEVATTLVRTLTNLSSPATSTLPLGSETNDTQDLAWEDIPGLDDIQLEIGYRLIPLFDPRQGGTLMNRMRETRETLSQALGFLVPSVHIVDNLDLSPNQYRLSIRQVVAGEGEVFPEFLLAINDGQVFGPVKGIYGSTLPFGQARWWIETTERDDALSLGYTVLDSGAVIATHCGQAIENHAETLLFHETVKQLLDRLALQEPTLVEALLRECSITTVRQVLRKLLSEKRPVTDLRQIVEILQEHAGFDTDVERLTHFVRVKLKPQTLQGNHQYSRPNL